MFPELITHGCSSLRKLLSLINDCCADKMVVLKWFLFCRNFVSLNYLHVGKKKRLRRLYFASRRSCLGNPFPADVSDCRLYHSHYNKCLYIWVCLRLSPLHFHWRFSNVLKKFSGCLYLSICVSLKMRPMCIVIFRRALNETEEHFTAVRAEQTETSLQRPFPADLMMQV